MLTCISYKEIREEQMGPVLLRATEIERLFRDLVKTGEELFLDKKDRQLMEAIDNAYRVDLYTVKTPLGQSCVTCLSTGCKLGLLLLHFHRKGMIPNVSFYGVGENVWDWLFSREDLDIHITSNDEDAWLFYKYVENEAQRKAVWEARSIEEHDIYDFSIEKESIAYDRYASSGEPPVCRITETLRGANFCERFKNKYWWPEEDVQDDFDTYTVINHCPVLWEDLKWRRHPFHIIGRRLDDGQYQWQEDLPAKYSTFMEVLCNHMMEGYFDYEEQEEHRFVDLYDSWFCLLLDCDERWPAREYTGVVLCGVEVNPAKKTIEIHGKAGAIETFHERFPLCVNVLP